MAGQGQGQGEAFYDVQFTLSTADVTGTEATSSSDRHPQAATPSVKAPKAKASSTVMVERVFRVHILAPFMYPPQALADFLQAQGQGLEGERARTDSGAPEGPIAPSEKATGTPPSRPTLIPLTMMHLPAGERRTSFTVSLPFPLPNPNPNQNLPHLTLTYL